VPLISFEYWFNKEIKPPKVQIEYNTVIKDPQIYQSKKQNHPNTITQHMHGIKEEIQKDTTFWICSVVMFVGGNGEMTGIICGGCCILFNLLCLLKP
jgi:uncharacterized ion transporter superfamily protein YfcC